MYDYFSYVLNAFQKKLSRRYFYNKKPSYENI